jgi:hypothetical protein
MPFTSLCAAASLQEPAACLPEQASMPSFSLDYKGLQPGMAAQPIGPNKSINQKEPAACLNKLLCLQNC